MSETMSNLYQATSQALTNAANNAVANQQQAFVTMQAATTMGVSTLYSIDTSATAVATQELIDRAKRDIEAAAVPSELATSPAVLLPIHELTADDVAYAMRTTMNAVAASIDALGAAAANNMLRIVQIAAVTACLTAMIAQPEKAGSYEEILIAIKRIV